MELAVPDVAPPAEISSDTPLVRHVKRPEWGVGALVWERDDTRAYQFEDGRLRKIRKGYYALLEPANDLDPVGDRVRDGLRRVLDAEESDSGRRTIEPVAPFAAQVELFTKLYPGGFQDPKWIEDHRESNGAALKRHRTPAVAEAAQLLSPAACEAALASDRHTELTDGIASLLAGTDLVPVSRAKAIRGLEPAEKRRFADAVVDLLHGERPFDARFRTWLAVLTELFDESPGWRMATVLPGLVHPQTQSVVRRSAFIRQAGSTAPAARYSRKPRAHSYRNFRRVAHGTRERLSAAGHEPRDLLDVYDFIWTTLRTSALEHLGGGR